MCTAVPVCLRARVSLCGCCAGGCGLRVLCNITCKSSFHRSRITPCRQVGEILGHLELHGFSKDTLIFLTSDNGPYQEEGWEHCGRGNIYSADGALQVSSAVGRTCGQLCVVTRDSKSRYQPGCFV